MCSRQAHPPDAPEKRCSLCGETKQMDAFAVCRKVRDGRAAACKDCMNSRRRRDYARDPRKERTYYDAHYDERQAYRRQHYLDNKDAYITRSAERRVTHRDEIAAQRKAHYQANREAILAAQKEYRLAHPEKVFARRLAYRRKNRARLVAASASWVKAHPEQARLLNRVRQCRRRYRERQADGYFTRQDIEALYDAQEGQCAYCLTPLERFHIDHRMPLARGGTHWPSNLALACAACNCSKGARTADEFAAYLREESS